METLCGVVARRLRMADSTHITVAIKPANPPHPTTFDGIPFSEFD